MINNQIFKQPIYFSPIVKGLATTSSILGAISGVAGAIIFASNAQLITLGSISAILATLPPILPIALCTIGASVFLISSIYLLCFNRHLNSQYQEALICFKGTANTPKNEEKAFELFYKAANSGHIFARLHLARCYRNGWGCKKDKVKSFELVRKIAAKGNHCAQFALVECYDLGKGCKQNSNKAFGLLKKLTLEKFVPAQFMMAERYYNEDPEIIIKQQPNLKDINQIKIEAIKWFTLIANPQAKGKNELTDDEVAYLGLKKSYFIDLAKKAISEIKDNV